jgi:hypothetical protein
MSYVRLKFDAKERTRLILVASYRLKSFHLVTQDGNRMMQMDSNSMATIALVTLIFLPMSVVSVSESL